MTAERERLEGLLHEWLALSARNVQKLAGMKEGYKKLKEEMEQREAAFGKWNGLPAVGVTKAWLLLFCVPSYNLPGLMNSYLIY